MNDSEQAELKTLIAKIDGSVPLEGAQVQLSQYGGGPASQPNFALHHATLYASKDPVAIDTVALKRLDEWRSKESFPPIGRLASYVQSATIVGLGNSDMSRIEVKNVGR